MLRFLVATVWLLCSLLCGCQPAMVSVVVDVIDMSRTRCKVAHITFYEDESLTKVIGETFANDGPAQGWREDGLHATMPRGTIAMADAPGLTGPGQVIYHDGYYLLHLYAPTPPSKATLEPLAPQ